MISFIEKDPWYDSSPYTGDCWMYPTFMLKNGKELFVFNRRDPQASYKNAELEAHKKFLLNTDGRFLKFNGYYNNPLEMLKQAAVRHYRFTEPKDLWLCGFEKTSYSDFHGNFREVSAAFHYRIYDADLIKAIFASAEHLVRQEWELV